MGQIYDVLIGTGGLIVGYMSDGTRKKERLEYIYRCVSLISFDSIVCLVVCELGDGPR